MEPHEIEEIRAEFVRQHARESRKGRKWSGRIAKRAGWALCTLRVFRNGTYHGNNELIAQTLKPLLARNDRQGRRSHTNKRGSRS